ncbi:MAG: hypothetical protein Q4E12_08430 [Coriobacteriia bacterium]|nr:hypothetical protein [Coriobacteriia bacterium]
MTHPRRPPSDMAVTTKAKELRANVVQATQRSPKACRFTLASRMQNLALDVVEQLFRANEAFVASGDTDATVRAGMATYWRTPSAGACCKAPASEKTKPRRRISGGVAFFAQKLCFLV